MWNAVESGYDIRDSVRGVVTGCSAKGVYLDLDNGQGAFATFGSLPCGSEVFCTVLKKPTDRWLTLVAIDAVVDDGRRVA
jgi:hypothetical protein